jgi:hypothetical protein
LDIRIYLTNLFQLLANDRREWTFLQVFQIVKKSVRDENLNETRRLIGCTGSKIHRTDENGNSWLHIVCEAGFVYNAGLLIRKGADVNKANSHGLTPVHLACKNGHLEILELLVH